MKFITSALTISLFLPFSGLAQTEEVELELPNCAMFDTITLKHLSIMTIVEEYYTQTKVWPDSLEELKTRTYNSVTTEYMETFLSEFEYIRMKDEKPNLILSYGFYEDSKMIKTRVILEPGNLPDEIVQNAKQK